MYLHIGKDIIIHNEDIIGIFNIEYIKNTKEYKNCIMQLQEINHIKDISENQKKTFILIEKNNQIEGYITNISTNTIVKRKM